MISRLEPFHRCCPQPATMLHGDVWRCHCGQRWRCVEHPLYGGRITEAITWWQWVLGL